MVVIDGEVFARIREAAVPSTNSVIGCPPGGDSTPPACVMKDVEGTYALKSSVRLPEPPPAAIRHADLSVNVINAALAIKEAPSAVIRSVDVASVFKVFIIIILQPFLVGFSFISNQLSFIVATEVSQLVKIDIPLYKAGINTLFKRCLDALANRKTRYVVCNHHFNRPNGSIQLLNHH